MKPQEVNKKRNKLLAVFLGLALPGLGQIYNSELVKGVSYFIITLSLIIIGFRLTVLIGSTTNMYYIPYKFCGRRGYWKNGQGRWNICYRLPR